ncbi:MAG TPA: helical backbone metal receptor [Gemmatimonadaceae bacterium]|nr:helical backbone metal receptor [Gemmatimonadaceae bacterium]
MSFLRSLSVLLPVVLFACARGEETDRARGESAAPTIVDDFGDTVALAPARRIASLNPTTTELLFTIGAGDRVVGRTTYDEWPAAARAVPDLGGGIRPNVEAVLGARPDLVILYASNDNRDAARALRTAGVRTLGLKLDRVADLRRAATILGPLVEDTERALAAADSVEATIARVRASVRALPRPRVLWYLWDNPLLVLGNGSYQSELLDAAGGANLYADRAEPAAQVALEDVLRRDPEVILLDSGRVAPLRASPRWAGTAAVRGGRLLPVNDALLNRPGVTMGMATAELARALHPGWSGP